MCGIWGFAARADGPADLTHLMRVASMASSRGMDACGAAAFVEGGIVARRAAGPFCLHPEIVHGFEPARAVIGNARLATTGDYSLDSAQPIVRGDVALVHNGVVPGHHAAAKRRKIELRTGCDSELLAAIAERAVGSPEGRIAESIEALPRDTPYAILAIVAGILVASCRGLPLYSQAVRQGVYFGSRKFDIMNVPPVGPGVHRMGAFRSEIGGRWG